MLSLIKDAGIFLDKLKTSQPRFFNTPLIHFLPNRQMALQTTQLNILNEIFINKR